MTKRRYDVIVVGAGPAGTTAARHCALKGLDTLLIEKKEFPRYKPCGGAVSGWALSALGLDLPPEIVEHECFGARIFFGSHSTEASKPCRVGILVSRTSFDAFLLQEARDSGAQVLLSTRAWDFQADADHVEVVTPNGSFSAECLVIAEGAMGRMAQKIRGPYRKQEIALTMVTEVASPQNEIERRTGGSIQIYFDVAHRGYGWVFPHRGHYSVGLGGIRGKVSRPTDLLREFLAKQGFHGKQRLRGCFLPVGGVKRQVAKNRVILVGDAAGFVDAFTGEGIGYAILSGRLAAETIHDTLGQRDASRIDLTPFQDRCHGYFGARLRYANYASRILHALPDVFLRTLSTYPEVIDRLLELATGKASYRDFLFWFLARTPRYLLSRLWKT
jgi:geranylgeranyl reductase family protein